MPKIVVAVLILCAFGYVLSYLFLIISLKVWTLHEPLKSRNAMQSLKINQAIYVKSEIRLFILENP
jgi:hypothetical protein